jgi:diaminopimelate decarboxylase
MSATGINEALSRAVAAGHVSDDIPAAFFYDMTAFTAQCRALVSAFPPTALHGFAIKACPVVGVVRAACAAGLGAECASVGEVAVALAAGIAAADVVFDSPVKTDAHLRYALSRGVHVNADSVEEVGRIAAVRAGLGHGVGEGSVVGLRVNPQVGSATIAETFTASASSKFGVPLAEARGSAVGAFREHPFMSCVHVHVGSQGCAVDVLVAGVVAAVELADEINATVGGGSPRRVTSIDIGGGLSVDYDGDESGPTFEEYGAALRAAVPRLFERYRVVTEFGRKLAAKAGWVAARVQHVKEAGGRVISLGHAGADVFMRPVYVGSKWRHRLRVMGASGAAEKGGPRVALDVAGPLCFSGDLLAVGRALPRPAAGDWVVVLDAGAYTLSMLNRHTSQLVPPVYGYWSGEPGRKTETLMKGETLEELVRFWS